MLLPLGKPLKSSLLPLALLPLLLRTMLLLKPLLLLTSEMATLGLTQRLRRLHTAVSEQAPPVSEQAPLVSEQAPLLPPLPLPPPLPPPPPVRSVCCANRSNIPSRKRSCPGLPVTRPTAARRTRCAPGGG